MILSYEFKTLKIKKKIILELNSFCINNYILFVLNKYNNNKNLDYQIKKILHYYLFNIDIFLLYIYYFRLII